MMVRKEYTEKSQTPRYTNLSRLPRGEREQRITLNLSVGRALRDVITGVREK